MTHRLAKHSNGRSAALLATGYAPVILVLAGLTHA